MSRIQRPQSYYQAVHQSRVTGAQDKDSDERSYHGIRKGSKTETFTRRASHLVANFRGSSDLLKERIVQSSPAFCKPQLCNGLCYLVAFIFVSVSIGITGLGLANWESCPASLWIPRFLLAAGILGFLYSLVNLGFLIIQREPAKMMFHLIFLFFLFCLLLIGSVSVLGVETQMNSVRNSNLTLLVETCDKTLRSFALGYVIFGWILISSAFIFCIISVIYMKYVL